MFLLILIIFSTPLYGQVANFSFLGIGFDMTQDDIYQQIQNSSDLIPAEDSLLRQLIPPTPYTLVLKSNNSNNNMIQRVFVDFNEETSYQVTVFLNSSYFSFYTLSEKMQDVYGVPDSRDSKKVIWFDLARERRASLEFPATIKYTYMPRFVEVLRRQEQVLEQGQSESVDYKERQRILNEL